MLILLPAAVLGFLWHLVSRRRGTLGLSQLSRRGSLIVAFLAFQALLEIGTQLTSIGHHFTRGSLTAYWAVLLILLAIAAWPDIKRTVENLPVRPRPGSFLKQGMDRIGTENAIWLTVVAFIVGVLGYLGWSFLPSNGDSLVYHLVRVAHWVQDQTVGPFATHYLAQIELSPLSEFNLAHLHLLVGSDRLDSYVQLLACIVCLVRGVGDRKAAGRYPLDPGGGRGHLRHDPVRSACRHEHRERLLRRRYRHRSARHRSRLAA